MIERILNIAQLSENIDLFKAIPGHVLHGVVLLTGFFFLLVLWRFIVQWFRLGHAIRGLRASRKELRGGNPAQLNSLFAKRPFGHIWSEYSDTLHPMRIGVQDGTLLLEYRSSVPAEVMFTKDALVDGPLFDDFFRHLPGILTGLGIIGTFSGLLAGLGEFRQTLEKPVQEVTNAAVTGLGPLLGEVMHAFMVSAAAIGCAMFVVFFGRLFVSILSSKVETLTELIDSLYKSGAGEEYLQRLVESSENSEAHTAQLKDALVEDLTRLMTNLTERQIQAQITAGQHVGEVVGRSISDSIAEPMQRVREVMERNMSGATEQVGSVLETLLTGFMGKLEDAFGGQINGINEQMQRSMAAMASVQSSLQELVTDIQKANQSATADMSSKLAAAMEASSANQQQLTQQMTQFVTDFRSLVSEEQRKSKETMDQSIASVLAEVQSSIESMNASRKQASDEDMRRVRSLTEDTGQVVSNMASTVEDVLKAVSDQVVRTQDNISAIQNVSVKAIDGMNQGALTMGSAAQKFEVAGNSVTRVLDGSEAFLSQLKTAANALQAASLAVNNGFEKYDATRKSVDAQVAALSGFIETAKREAGVSQQLITGIETSVQALRRAEEDSRRDLENVHQNLVDAFETFGNSLVGQVQRVMSETDTGVSKATHHLTGVVQELARFTHSMRKQ